MTKTKAVHPIYLKAAKGEYITHADIASLVRAALKRVFPATKFTVKTKTYSGGGSVTVSWTDGPRAEYVERIVKQYKTKGFDGSIDLAHYADLWMYPDGTAHVAHDSGTAGSGGHRTEVIESPRTGEAVLVSNIAGSFIFCSRSYSAAHFQRAIDKVKATNWLDLKDFDWSKIKIHVSPHGYTHIEGGRTVPAYQGDLETLIMWEANRMSA